MLADGRKRDRLSTTTRWKKGFITSCRLEKISHTSYIIIMATRGADLSSVDWVLTNDAVLASQVSDIGVSLQSLHSNEAGSLHGWHNWSGAGASASNKPIESGDKPFTPWCCIIVSIPTCVRRYLSDYYKDLHRLTVWVGARSSPECMGLYPELYHTWTSLRTNRPNKPTCLKFAHFWSWPIEGD